MNDLFKKLNVLIKSSVNDAVRSAVNPDDASVRHVRVDKNLAAEVDALRGRINDAVRYEDGLKARIQQYEDEAARWDKQADEAVANRNEASARYAIEQMKRVQQRAATVAGDLRAHQQATEELIQRVNMLDAVVADVRRAAAEETPTQTEARPTPEAAEQAPAAVHLPDLGNVLRDAREKITALGELAQAQREVSESGETSPPDDEAVIDDDLEQRRQRLSRR